MIRITFPSHSFTECTVHYDPHWLARLILRREPQDYVAYARLEPGGLLAWFDEDCRRRITNKRVLRAIEAEMRKEMEDEMPRKWLRSVP